MGLIRAIQGAVGGVTADQWREYFYCDSLEENVLMTKGKKRVSGKRSSNTSAEDNIITNGSIIAVNNGQCMMIVEQGKVVEVCAEPGEFVYDSSSEPSIFFGSLGDTIVDTFKTVGKRFTFGGDTAKDQRVYFFNTKEIIGNKYGTANPIPFRVVDKNIGLDIEIALRCNGEYSYRMMDPLLFYTNVCGNQNQEYTRDRIDSQLKSEIMNALQPAFGKISEMGIRYYQIVNHTTEVTDALNEILSEKWMQLRGLAIFSFNLNSVTAPDEDVEMIKTLQKNAVLRNPGMAAATLVGAQAEAMVGAANNDNGAMLAFAGMNMASQAGGMNANQLFAMDAASKATTEPTPQASGTPLIGWTCACGATNNTGKFCAECGEKKPDSAGWTCACGAVNQGKFCAECGAKKPANAPLYKCDKCGYEPEDPMNPPKFCPECGDVFDDNDLKS